MCCMHDEVQCQGMHDLRHCCKWSQVFPDAGHKMPTGDNKYSQNSRNFLSCCFSTTSGFILPDQLLTMQGVTERASDQKCQLMVVCSGADAIVKCSPCMHTIACRGCLLASVTLLKNCTVCDGMIEHFKFG
jgi:hypothetical protein